MILRVVTFKVIENREVTPMSESIKKLKYLKNPSIPKLADMLINSNNSLRFSRFSFARRRPMVKSIAELATIKPKNLQSHQP